MSTCPHCGADAKSGRSSPDHRRFFALINAAFVHWPEGAEFVPSESEHLRSWLLCKAGYCERTPVEYPAGDVSPHYTKLMAIACESALRASNGRGFIRVHGDQIVVFTPKSIAWDKLDQKQFNDIRDKVTDVIEDVLGVRAELLLTEHESAA